MLHCYSFLAIAPIYAGSVWTQLLTALVIGLLTAFAFQFLLTSLGIAVGISVWSVATIDRFEVQPDSATDSTAAHTVHHSDADNRSGSKIGLMAGFGILFTVNTVLFAACFLAAKFSQASDPLSGAIEGIVIWSAYVLLLLWLSSTAMSSVVGAVLGATTGGFRQLVSTIGSALSSREADVFPDEQQLMALQQEIQEMQSVLDPESLRHLIETQLQSLSPDALTTETPSRALRSVVAETSVSDTTDVSDVSDVSGVSDVPDTPPVFFVFWQQVESYLQDASAKDLAPKRLDRKLQKIWEVAQSDASAELADDSISNGEYNQGAFQQILDRRDDLSEKKKTRILNQLEETWAYFLETYEPPATVDSTPADSMDEDEPDNAAQSIAQLTTKLLQSASDASLDQLLANLPTLLQWLRKAMPAEMPSVVPLILSIALDKIRGSVGSTNAEPESQSHASNRSTINTSSINYAVLKHSIDRLLEGSSELASLNQALVGQLEEWRDRSLQQVDSIQQAAQDRIDAVKQQAQQRLEETRRAAAAAAWWLVITVSTGVLSSALAGALAAGLDLADFIPQ